ncbi:hypothetical protein EDB92DRAFT_1813499 [Lactarius akahatsu]|uniref:Uncharacterized protein n=1 Tax=Lactarius akahatsu TaxID=416441 RepID=A0AAD4QH06_9AGAM|nr:hypothetical protein EDB92DRAFT_1813499 [Lactarius akahatsu]
MGMENMGMGEVDTGKRNVRMGPGEGDMRKGMGNVGMGNVEMGKGDRGKGNMGTHRLFCKTSDISLLLALFCKTSINCWQSAAATQGCKPQCDESDDPILDPICNHSNNNYDRVAAGILASS